MTEVNKAIYPEFCDMEYYGDFPSGSITVFSCSIFKLGDMYRDVSVYINGLQRCIDYLSNKGIFLRIYYDHSIENDPKFAKLKKHGLGKNTVQFCKYHCLTMLDGELHKGIFGMFMRFLPFFDKSLENNIRYILDIDVSNRELTWYQKTLDKFNQGNYNCVVVYLIGYEWRYVNLFNVPATNEAYLANVYLKGVTVPISLFNDIILKLQNNDPDLLKTFNKVFKTKDDKKYTNQIVTYGSDEWFINTVVIDWLTKQNIKIGKISIYDRIELYISSMVRWNRVDREVGRSYLKTLLGKSYTGDLAIDLKKVKHSFMCPLIKTLNDYNRRVRNIKRFYKITKKFTKKLGIRDRSWLNNLKKNVNTQNSLCLYMLKNDQGDNLEVVNYLLDNILINPL